jgi:betaine-aldehyde dehydrogenase
VTLTVVNLATEEPIAELQHASVEGADAAIARAKAASPSWRVVAPSDRARLLHRLASPVEELAHIEPQTVATDK